MLVFAFEKGKYALVVVGVLPPKRDQELVRIQARPVMPTRAFEQPAIEVRRALVGHVVGRLPIVGFKPSVVPAVVTNAARVRYMEVQRELRPNAGPDVFAVNARRNVFAD